MLVIVGSIQRIHKGSLFGTDEEGDPCRGGLASRVSSSGIGEVERVLVDCTISDQSHRSAWTETSQSSDSTHLMTSASH
jgi:hypothetical protein